MWKIETAEWISRTKVARAKELRGTFQLLCENIVIDTMPQLAEERITEGRISDKNTARQKEGQ